jgi:CRISPR/Cas system-associated exonuclease Cas4 (RecB family)
LLAEAFCKKNLLPLSPNAYFGTVLHKMLEYISKHEINTDMDFERRFSDEVLVMEDYLNMQGYAFFVPLQINVKDFGIKKILLRKHLKYSECVAKQFSGASYSTEKWVESKDKLIGGKIDFIVEDELKTELIDFKTGAINQDTIDDSGEVLTGIKEEYQEQLKLYAYLYFECFGKYPTHLSIVDLSKQKHNVEFSSLECRAIYENAKCLLVEMNKSIDTALFSANPCKTNCKYCLYRPACSFYLHAMPIDGMFGDVCGSIIKVSKFLNRNITVSMQTETNSISILGFTTDHYDYFTSIRDKPVKLFNLRKEATDFVYSTTKTTMIYA